MTLKDKMLIYIYRKLQLLEQDKETLNAMRYKGSFDSLDMYEIMRSDIRIQCFNEILDDLYKIIFCCK